MTLYIVDLIVNLKELNLDFIVQYIVSSVDDISQLVNIFGYKINNFFI